MTSKELTSVEKLIAVHYIAIKIPLLVGKKNIRISLHSAKSISENREKLSGFLLSSIKPKSLF